jgi:hypothetical protein
MTDTRCEDATFGDRHHRRQFSQWATGQQFVR